MMASAFIEGHPDLTCSLACATYRGNSFTTVPELANRLLHLTLYGWLATADIPEQLVTSFDNKGACMFVEGYRGAVEVFGCSFGQPDLVGSLDLARQLKRLCLEFFQTYF